VSFPAPAVKLHAGGPLRTIRRHDKGVRSLVAAQHG